MALLVSFVVTFRGEESSLWVAELIGEREKGDSESLLKKKKDTAKTCLVAVSEGSRTKTYFARYSVATEFRWRPRFLNYQILRYVRPLCRCSHWRRRLDHGKLRSEILAPRGNEPKRPVTEQRNFAHIKSTCHHRAFFFVGDEVGLPTGLPLKSSLRAVREGPRANLDSYSGDSAMGDLAPVLSGEGMSAMLSFIDDGQSGKAISL